MIMFVSFLPTMTIWNGSGCLETGSGGLVGRRLAGYTQHSGWLPPPSACRSFFIFAESAGL